MTVLWSCPRVVSVVTVFACFTYLLTYEAWGATVRGTYGTAEAGTRTQCVQYARPWAQAALRLQYVPNAGGGYA